MKRGDIAMFSSPGIKTSECAAYGSPHPPLPLRDFSDCHDYDPVEEVNPAYIQSATYDGVEDPHDDTCEDEEGHYEAIPE